VQTNQLSSASTLDARFLHQQQQILLDQQRQLLRQQQQLAVRQQELARRPATPSDGGLSTSSVGGGVSSYQMHSMLLSRQQQQQQQRQQQQPVFYTGTRSTPTTPTPVPMPTPNLMAAEEIPVECIQMTTNGRFVVTGSIYGPPQVWDLKVARQRCSITLLSHSVVFGMAKERVYRDISGKKSLKFPKLRMFLDTEFKKN